MAARSAACSCGAVQYQVKHDLETVVNCHCTDCRRMSGCAFSSMVVSVASAGEFTRGQECLGAYLLSESVTKHFCARCGTPMFNTNSRLPGLRMLYLGTIDQHEDLAPSLNVYCRSQLSWVSHLSDFESHAGAPESVG